MATGRSEWNDSPAWLGDVSAEEENADGVAVSRPSATGLVIGYLGSGKTASYVGLVAGRQGLPYAPESGLGLVTHHGVLVNGNSRASALRELGMDAAKTNYWAPAQSPLASLRPIPYQPRRLRALEADEYYARLMARAAHRERIGLDQRQVEYTTSRRVRSAMVRKAVLRRSNGQCENPECRDKRPVGWTDGGDPILEIDHVVEHASGGRDHGENMIALCPNCHALKTRGRERAELTLRLVRVAAERHRAAINRSKRR
ncbi:HNH endonuclease signature motif containing protein [Streptomyces sp. NPDC005708]|uniref:HNH endonuclease signature motif containing protein n=1 Tax=Streptomyces sp. NPDC005708 TaxID=3154564 RepID=UPI0034077582